jgi:hypothetical protein
MKSITPTFVALFCITSPFAFAAEETKSSQALDLRDQAVAQTGLDPTLVRTNLGGSFRSNTNHDSGSDTNRWVATGALAKDHLSLAGEVPLYVRSNPGAGDTVSGFGDVLLRGQARYLIEGARVAAVLETSLNTSTKNLGARANVITPELAASKHLDEKHTVSGQIRWSFDAGREDGVDDTNLGELRAGLLSMWGVEGFTKFEGRIDRDYVHNENALTGVVAIGRNFDLHHTGYIETTQPLSHDARERRGWDLNLTYQYSF